MRKPETRGGGEYRESQPVHVCGYQQGGSVASDEDEQERERYCRGDNVIRP